MMMEVHDALTGTLFDSVMPETINSLSAVIGYTNIIRINQEHFHDLFHVYSTKHTTIQLLDLFSFHALIHMYSAQQLMRMY